MCTELTYKHTLHTLEKYDVKESVKKDLGRQSKLKSF